MKKLVTDQDGTLILEPPIGRLAEVYDFEKENNVHLERFYKGLESYDELVKSTVRQLMKRRVSREEIVRFFKSLTPTPGIGELTENLNGNGLAIISGGLIEISEVHGITQHFKESQGVRFTYDNKGYINGHIPVEGTKEGKLGMLEEVVRRNRIPYKDIVYMGDSGNDYLIAKRVLEQGGIFLFVQPEQSQVHHYKESEKPQIEELERIATGIIKRLDEALDYL